MCKSLGSTWKSRSDSREHWKGGDPFFGALEGGAPFCIPSVFSQQEACIKQLRHFTPFVASVDGVLSVETKATLKMIASCLATKWRQHYSRTCRYVKSRVAITLVRSTHRCIRGSRVPAHKISVYRLQWEDGSKINLFR